MAQAFRWPRNPLGIPLGRRPCSQTLQPLEDDPSIKENLRLGRELKENMVPCQTWLETQLMFFSPEATVQSQSTFVSQVITVEPGFYFIDYLIEEALADPKKGCFINQVCHSRCARALLWLSGRCRRSSSSSGQRSAGCG